MRDLVPAADETLEAPETVRTVADFTRWITSQHPALEGRMASVRVARNEQFAGDDEALADGDVLALIPPVAGGS